MSLGVAVVSSLAMASSVPRTKLGSQRLEVSKQGLGCMGMSAFYGPPNYGPHTNEILVGKALKGIRHRVQLATKYGIHYENGQRSFHGGPGYVRSACEASLKRLDVDYIDLYYQHRVDYGSH